MKSFGFIIIFIDLLIGAAFAQTDSLNIYWDPNTEPDVYRYKLQRSVNSTANFEDFQTVNHPQVHVVDHSVDPGKLYAYRVAAIDSAGNMSLYSAAAVVGIPLIQWHLSAISAGQNTTIPRSAFLDDYDHNITELQLDISQTSNVSVTVQNENIVLAPSPAGYIGPASFTLRAEDPDGLFDLKTVSFEFNEGSSAVFTVYPNPIKTDKGHKEMIFTNLPAEARIISLYSLMGERVYEEDLTGLSVIEYRINVVENSVYLPSGLYIYMIRDEGSRVLGSGKIVIIR